MEFGNTTESRLSVGLAIVIQVTRTRGAPIRIKGIVRGWQVGAYVLLDVPELKSAAGPFRADQRCSLRFLASGDACGCDTSVLDVGTGSHFTYMRVRWPQALSTVRVRRHQRVQIDVSCSVETERGGTHEGHVTDISAGGCRVLTPAAIRSGSRISLSFTLPDATIVESVAAMVCSSSVAANGSACLGCEFTDLDDINRYMIDFYVALHASQLRGGDAHSVTVLLVHPEPDSLHMVRRELTELGYDVRIAADAVDGFSMLRVTGTSVLVVNTVLPDLDGLSVCAALRKGQRFAKLPIILFGGSEDLRKRAMDGGANHFSPAIPTADEIHRVIQKLVGV